MTVHHLCYPLQVIVQGIPGIFSIRSQTLSEWGIAVALGAACLLVSMLARLLAHMPLLHVLGRSCHQVGGWVGGWSGWGIGWEVGLCA